MTEQWLSSIVQWSRRGLLLLLVVSMARLLYVAWLDRASEPPQSSNVAKPGGVQASPELVELYESITRGQPEWNARRLANGVESASSAAATAAAAATTTRVRAIHVYLVVNVSPDRSEVIVNGVARGQTPYVGEVDCQSGSTMTVTVLARKGDPKTFERACDRSEIRIDESGGR